MLTITSKHPVRAAIANLSSGNRYYDSKGQALGEVERVLNDHNLELAYQGCDGCPGDSGYFTFPLRTVSDACIVCEDCDKGGDVINGIAFSWYRMPSGRWEIVVYVS